MILGGNRRYKAGLDVRMDEVPVKVAGGLTEAQEKEFMIKDNVSGGEWDWDALLNEWETEQLDDWGLDVPEDFLDKKEVVEDDFDTTPPVEPKTKMGELWTLGTHKLLVGDSTKREDVERLMGGEKADMVYCDPPYGMNLDTDYSSMSGSMGIKSGKIYRPLIGDNEEWDFEKANWFDCDEQFWWGGDWYRRTLPLGGSWFVWDKRRDEKQDEGFGSTFE